MSRNGHVFKAYPGLCKLLGRAVKAKSAILDGELVVLDAHGHPQLLPLLFRRAEPCFAAFDVLHLDGRDLRDVPLLERKRALRRILPRRSNCVLYVDHVRTKGCALFREVVPRDVEGIIAKPAASPYRMIAGRSPWTKIKNRAYTQTGGRHEFFEPRRRRRLLNSA